MSQTQKRRQAASVQQATGATQTAEVGHVGPDRPSPPASTSATPKSTPPCPKAPPIRRLRVLRTFTPDLEALADWLTSCHVDTVAMESTGVYWIPIYELFKAHRLPGLLGQRPPTQECLRQEDRHS